jgi:hypothetical protein
MPSLFSKIQSDAERAGILPRTKASKDWFIRKIKGMTQILSSKILNDNSLEVRNKPLIGRVFMFLYDPKGKETLPYYDRFPLIIMVGPAKKGFYGLNLHYLPPRQRAIFFDRLMDYTNNKKYDQTTRFRLTYDMLNSSAKLRAFAPCFKHYLYDHIVSKTVEVLPPEWEIALFLPSDSFVNETNLSIWQKTRSLI